MQRAFLLTGLGALAALGAAWLPVLLRSPPPPSVRPAFWVCDRDGGRVLGLDLELLVERSASVRSPLDLISLEDGRLWVLQGDRSPPGGGESLARLSPSGELELELPVPGARRLVRAGRSAALVLADSEGESRILEVDRDGHVSPRIALTERGELAAGPAGVLLAADGALRLLDTDVVGDLPRGEVSSLAAAGDGWWMVARNEGDASLIRLDAQLNGRARRRITELGLPSAGRLHLAPTAGSGGVWVAHERGEAVWVDHTGAIRARGFSPLPGVEGCLATPDGGVLLLLPGAVVRLDPAGRPRPGQGGFDFLVAIDAT